jgi:hypothetical protein
MPNNAGERHGGPTRRDDVKGIIMSDDISMWRYSGIGRSAVLTCYFCGHVGREQCVVCRLPFCRNCGQYGFCKTDLSKLTPEERAQAKECWARRQSATNVRMGFFAIGLTFFLVGWLIAMFLFSNSSNGEQNLIMGITVGITFPVFFGCIALGFYYFRRTTEVPARVITLLVQSCRIPERESDDRTNMEEKGIFKYYDHRESRYP